MNERNIKSLSLLVDAINHVPAEVLMSLHANDYKPLSDLPELAREQLIDILRTRSIYTDAECNVDLVARFNGGGTDEYPLDYGVVIHYCVDSYEDGITDVGLEMEYFIVDHLIEVNNLVDYIKFLIR